MVCNATRPHIHIDNHVVLVPIAYEVQWHSPTSGRRVSMDYPDIIKAGNMLTSLHRHLPESHPTLTPIYTRKGYAP